MKINVIAASLGSMLSICFAFIWVFIKSEVVNLELIMGLTYLFPLLFFIFLIANLFIILISSFFFNYLDQLFLLKKNDFSAILVILGIACSLIVFLFLKIFEVEFWKSVFISQSIFWSFVFMNAFKYEYKKEIGGKYE